MIRILLDQGLPRSALAFLTAAGWDAVHTVDVGLNNAADSEILAYALRERRICITLDADFHALLAVSGAVGPSVIRIRRERLKGQQLAELLLRIWPDIDDQLHRGAMVTVTVKSGSHPVVADKLARFAKGVARAARWVAGKKQGLFDMRDCAGVVVIYAAIPESHGCRTSARTHRGLFEGAEPA